MTLTDAKDFNGFIAISRYAGMREDLVQAGGGNSSYKSAPDRMFIKASGYQLADLSESHGYSVVNPQIIRNAFMSARKSLTDADAKTILKDAVLSGGRPSIETFLHSTAGRYILHTHPMAVNVLTCRINGMNELAELFPNALMIPYATPGADLARKFFIAYGQHEHSEQIQSGRWIAFLQNHGLVVAGNTPEDVIAETERVTYTIEQHIGVNLRPYHELTALWMNVFADKILWKVTDSNVINCFRDAGGIWPHAFCPDCTVYLGKKFLEIAFPDDDIKAKVMKFTAENGEPVIIICNGEIYIAASSVKKALEIQSVLSFSAQVMSLNKGHECLMLSENEQRFLLGWDAEKYRMNLR